jgi:hypothetical protein
LRILALQVPAVESPNFRPARPPRLVSGTSTSMGGFPFRERGSGVSNRYNLDLDYPLLRCSTPGLVLDKGPRGARGSGAGAGFEDPAAVITAIPLWLLATDYGLRAPLAGGKGP